MPCDTVWQQRSAPVLGRTPRAVLGANVMREKRVVFTTLFSLEAVGGSEHQDDRVHAYLELELLVLGDCDEAAEVGVDL